jgi:hypothetical protein
VARSGLSDARLRLLWYPRTREAGGRLVVPKGRLMVRPGDPGLQQQTCRCERSSTPTGLTRKVCSELQRFVPGFINRCSIH